MTKPIKKAGKLLYRLAWPALFVYLRIGGGRTRVLVRAKGHILLVQSWLDDGRWGLPGGGLHRGEEAQSGAVREVAEETGIVLEVSTLLPLASEWRSREGLKFYCHFLEANLALSPKKLPITKQRAEIVAAEWVPLAQLHKLELKAEVQRALQLSAKR